MRKLGALVATSGPYADTVSGVVTETTNVQAGSYAIIPSTFTSEICVPFKLTVYTSSPGTAVSLISLR